MTKEELEEQIKHIEKVSDYNADQLAQAKDIITSLCETIRMMNKHRVFLTDVEGSLAEAEQFLKEIEK